MPERLQGKGLLRVIDPTNPPPPPIEGPDGSTRCHWVIICKPGCHPEVKGAFKQQEVEPFLRELIACRPAEAALSVVSLTWDFKLWVECGRERIAMADYVMPRRRKRK